MGTCIWRHGGGPYSGHHNQHWSALVSTRVFSKGRNAVCPSKSLIFWTFPDVLGFFDHSIWAIFHYGTFGTYD